MEKDKIERQIRFLIEIDRMKSIERRSYIYAGGRRENDAEHSWHTAMMAMILNEYAAMPGVDINRVVRMLLVHDLIEVYAGDTFAYDTAAVQDKAAREREAADKLYAILPGNQGDEYRALWEEFDREDTPDSIYAAALDRLQPLISNWLNRGATWAEGNVRARQVWRRMEQIKRGMPEIWEIVEFIIHDSIEKGYLAADETADRCPTNE